MIDAARAFREHYGYVCGQMAWTEHGEDATAYAFLQLVRCAPRLREGNLRGWLVVTARHRAFWLARRTEAETSLEMVLADGESFDGLEVLAAPGADPTAAAEARALLEAMGELKPQQREALSDRMAGLSYAECARKRGRTFTWVNRHIVEGKCALAEMAA